MKNIMLIKLPLSLTTLIVTCILIMPCNANTEEIANYSLSLSFSPAENKLIGTAKISIPSGKALKLFTDQLDITGYLIQGGQTKQHGFSQTKEVIAISPQHNPRELFLSFTYQATNSRTNLISENAISLTSNWFPVPQNPVLFTVEATLPDQFTAIVEADQFPLTHKDNKVKAVYSTPTTALHFNAGPYIVQKLQVRNKFHVYTMFFKEDIELASGYLEAAKRYLLKFENEIGPFPYNHYVIVANRLPTGYGMPTFTLLGQMVLRLPFIKSSSLGHEIVHSWFGNSVSVDTTSGNWCEGLTAFLSDQRFREDRGEGTDYRKESIIKYLNYATATAPIALNEFHSASHSQPMAEAKRAIGYNRGALFFNELREKIGKDNFYKSLQHFYSDNKGKLANWEHIRISFEKVTASDLSLFFKERLSRKDIPGLSTKDVELSYSNNMPLLSFDLIQETEKPYTISVPIHIETPRGILKTTREISQINNSITIQLQQRPYGFTIDPELSFMRQLAPEESLPVWSQFLGSKKKLIILADENSRLQYKPLLQSLERYKPEIITASEVTNADLSKNSLLFLDADQPAARSIFGQTTHPSRGFVLDSRQNPLNPDHVAVLISSNDVSEVSSVASKLKHYGKYSYLEFSHGRNREKNIQTSQYGISFSLEELPEGSSTKEISSFDQIIGELSRHRVIYIGESHTSMSDHLLQLRIIESLHKIQPNLAIGMEMFPSSSQAALDKYTLESSQMDERTFLKESKYYDVWRYDFRYFRDILNYAKNNQIPVLGLNVDRKIVSQVFKEGNTDGLKKELIQQLPSDRDLDMQGYKERLSSMYSIHSRDGIASGMQSGFIQAQAIWDETMAENIAHHLQSNPEQTVVVLAGTQHTRKDSGIPPRVARRIPVNQASVLNIYNNNEPKNLSDIADYYFFSAPQELPEKPRIGIVLNTIDDDDSGVSHLKIEQLSPHGKASEAGLLEGDIIEKIKDIAVSTMSELHRAMLDAKVGEKITIHVIRSGKNSEQKLVFEVELTAPQRPQGHP